MEASSAEGRGGYVDFSRLSPGEFLGMGAALLLLASLWLPWFSTSEDNPNSTLPGAGDGESANAWAVFGMLDWVLVAACAAPFILSWIVARGHKLTWKPGEVTMIVGISAFVLILCNGIILGRPGDSVDIGLGIGYFVALIASAGMLVAGYLRQAFYTTARKPPGSYNVRAMMANEAGVTQSGTGGAGPDRNLAMELVRTTEYAALACARWIGRGDKEGADGAAVDAMRMLLDTVSMDGVVVIGEGEKDEAPMLYNGEHIGDGSPPQVDIAVDPLEGTDLCAKGLPNAIATIALAERGTMFDPGPCVYMLKMATSRDVAHLLDLDRPLAQTLQLMAKEKGVQVGDLVVIMLDRPRHEDAIREVREAGGRVRLIPHGDVSASLAAVTEGSSVDLLYGIGGTPEGVLSATAIKCTGGQILGRLWPRSDEERSAALEADYDLDEVLDRDRLVSSDDCFFAATGVTDGEMLDGVHFIGPQGATTESISMRSRSGTVRTITARHDRAKLREILGERLG